MTVYDLQQRLSGDEYLGWSTYYKRKQQQEELARKKAG